MNMKRSFTVWDSPSIGTEYKINRPTHRKIEYE